jgi:group I intron endonuclease
MSDARTGKQHSDETRKKMSAAKLGKPRPEKAGKPSQAIEVFDQDTKLTIQFDTINAAAIALSINHSSIVKYFSNNQQKPYKGRYTFKKL